MPGQVPERPVADIALYYDFEHQPPAAVQGAMEQETISILGPMGETIEWRPLAKVRPGEVAVDLAVLSFKGTCDLSQPVPRNFDVRTLGKTHISDGAILPFSDIDCDRIRAFLDQELHSFRPGQRESAFGRAVGRVVAHELYHIFANTTHHASSGVARPAFTVKDLTATSFRLEEADILRAKRETGTNVAQRDSSPLVADGRSLFAGSGCVTCHGDRGEGTANGPALRSKRRFSLLSLGARLGDRASRMFRHARELGVPLRAFGENEIRAVLQFLNNPN
jgi:mono/diheme cytochrome c family protein